MGLSDLTPMLDFRLLFITDRQLAPRDSLETVVDAACEAGVRAVQLREKDLDSRSLFDLAVRLREITSAHGARLLVNDRVDIALAARADGIHKPEDGFPVVAARRFLGDDKLIGASTHSLERAAEMQTAGADFVTFGPVFETPSKKKYGPPQGLDALRRVAGALDTPVFALGGVTPQRAVACIEAGAAGVAVISAIAASSDIKSAVGEFREALEGL